MLERIGQPTDAALMPYDSSTCRWPSAVPPPWLPIAGTSSGSAPSERKCSTAARRIKAILAIPRLPAVMATLCPGCTRRCSSNRANWAWTSRGDVGHPRPGECLANAKDLGEVEHVILNL